MTAILANNSAGLPAMAKIGVASKKNVNLDLIVVYSIISVVASMAS